MEKSGLSKQILDYYYKFGQNRDLEKYLLLRGNQKSSSEGSVNTTSEFHGNNLKNVVTSKSLDNLTFHGKNKDDCENKTIEQIEYKQCKVKILSSNDTAKEFAQSKQTKTTSTQSASGLIEKEKGGENPVYSFSCESNISINLPLPVTSDNILPNNEKKIDNQSIIENSNTGDVTKLDQSNCSSNDNEFIKSPSKMEKRLEWDSLGDVGYNKLSKQRKQKTEITTLEKSVLKEFFANQGIEINFTSLEEIKEISEAEFENSQTKTNAREKWREVLDNARKKYNKNDSGKKTYFQNSTQTSFVRTIPDTHSTPKEKTTEKCVQTSIIHPSENKEVQVNITQRHSSILSTTEDGDSAVSPSSFEYIPPREIIYSESSDKENRNTLDQLSENHQLRKSKRSKNYDYSSTRTDTSDSSSGVNLGVKLLCSLIEAKSLSDKQKKILAKKIIAKITKKNIVIDSNEKTTTPSSNGAKSSSSLISTSNQSPIESVNCDNLVRPLKSNENSLSTSVKSSEQNKTQEKHFNEKSKMKYHESSNSSSEKNLPIRPQSADNQIKSGKRTSTIRSSSLPPKCVPSDKNDLLKNWLGNVTKSEINYAQRKLAEQQIKCTEKEIDVNAGGDSSSINRKPLHVMEFIELERMNHISWIDNEIKHLENLKKLLVTEKKSSSDSNFPSSFKPQSTITAYPIHRSLNLHLYDKVASSSRSTRKDHPSTKTTSAFATDKVVEVKRTESEEEIKNEKENYKRRIKRTTDEILCEKVNASTNGNIENVGQHLKVTTYVVNEEKRFPKKDYKIVTTVHDKNTKLHRSKLETPRQQFPDGEERSLNFKNQSSTESNHLYYSQLKDTDALRKQDKSEVYATSAGITSNFSSGSISLPGMTQSSSSSITTTTHRYDRQVGIGIQTSDSLLKSYPIFGKQKLNCTCKYVCKCDDDVNSKDKLPRSTIRQFYSKRNKQTQVKPSAVAYIINFENKSKSCRETTIPQQECYTLQDYLKKKRPDFPEHVKERQKVLNELKCLRQERQKKIENILQNANESSIYEKLNQLPPPPTKCVRIFGTKEMKARTKRHYRKLPEVIEKAEREYGERKKRNNRLLLNVFNKRLQGRVHQGKLTLEHSRTVI